LLLQTRSVTRTADLLGISQPAASRALAALRRAAGDPLLVRAGAEHIANPAREIAEALPAEEASARLGSVTICVHDHDTQARRRQ